MRLLPARRLSYCALALASSYGSPSASAAAALAFATSSSRSCAGTTRTTMSASGGSGSGGYTYKWPRPSVTVDTLIFTPDADPPGSGVSLLLIKRKHPPFQGHFALPGGFVDQDEDLDAAAARELEEETSVKGLAFAQIGAFGAPGRDPRGHTITVAYVAMVPTRDCGVQAGDDASEAQWVDLSKLPPLAFDHAEVIREAWDRIEVQDSGVVVERGSGKVLATLADAAQAAAVRAARPGFA